MRSKNENEKVHEDVVEKIVNEINYDNFEGSFEIECGDGVVRFVEWNLGMNITEQVLYRE